jgi:hypothetical protein
VKGVPVPSGFWKTTAEKAAFLERSLAATRRSQLDAMAPAIDPATPHGLFADACNVHVESSASWNQVKIDGVLMRDAAARSSSHGR